MSNKQTTAVQWLIEQTRSPAWRSLKRGDIIEQAKAIERKQIEDAYKQGLEDVYYFDGSRSDYEAEGTDKHLAERYFTSTFITE